jgi:uncharacterized membrane protein
MRIGGAAIGIATGLTLGFALVEVDHALGIDPDIFTFVDLQSARAVLQTIATVTVSVAGLAFSVTVVALQLASQQLSPRVMRTFQGDRLSQSVLAVFVGTFLYSLVVLAKLTERGVPALSITTAILAAMASFALFVAFIHHIVVSLKASTIIKRIGRDGRGAIANHWPRGAGDPVKRDDGRSCLADRGTDRWHEVRAPRAGFVTRIDGATVIACAQREDLIVRQCTAIGDFALTGTVLAQAYGEGARREALAEIATAFSLEDERSVVFDVTYPVRQLADVALRAMSPGVNDPTTARNAMNSLADLVVCFARSETAEPIRADGAGTPRLITVAPGLDELVRTGFEETRLAAVPHPVFARHMLGLLGAVREAAQEHGHGCDEIERQARLLAHGAQRAAALREDADAVEAVHHGATAS